MIRVTVELIPYGVGKPRTLGTAVIANDGTGTPTRGNYVARFYNKRGRMWKTSTLRDWPRKRRIAWDLLRCLLQNTVKP